MGKTLLYRLFGLGKIPAAYLEKLEPEGVVFRDEGLGGSIRFRNYRAPGARYGRRVSAFSGALLLTRKHIAAFMYSRPVVLIPIVHEGIENLKASRYGEQVRFEFQAEDFHDDRSGSIDVRITTDQARKFLAEFNSLRRAT